MNLLRISVYLPDDFAHVLASLSSVASAEKWTKVSMSKAYRSVHRPPFFTACRLTKAAWSLELGVAKLSSIPSSMVELCYV